MEYNIKKAIKEYGFVTDPGGEAKNNIEDLIMVMDKLKAILPTKSFGSRGGDAGIISELNSMFLTTVDSEGKEQTAPITDIINKMLALIYELPDIKRINPQDVMKPRLNEDGPPNLNPKHPFGREYDIEMRDKELKTMFKYIFKKFNMTYGTDSIRDYWHDIVFDIKKMGYNWFECDYIVAAFDLNVLSRWDGGEFDWDIAEGDIIKPGLSNFKMEREINFDGWGHESAEGIIAYSEEHVSAMAWDGQIDFDDFEVSEYSHWDVQDEDIEEM